MNLSPNGLNRLMDLLSDRATELLAPAEESEMMNLLNEHPEVEDDTFDRIAAALDLALGARELEPMPAALHARVEGDAVQWLARSRGLSLEGGLVDEAELIRPIYRSAPWLLAAACIIVALLAWWPGASTPSVPEAPRTALAQLAEQPGTVRVPWADESGQVSGEVIWNSDTQQGFMVFRGLDVNDPKAMQYQLWIFDDARKSYSDNVAVDGGVFDIAADTGEVIVPVQAKLPVADPFLFAVTTEPPGGVVKHNPERDPDRFKIILTAKL